jgi:outer membrane protein assembly factor BamB
LLVLKATVASLLTVALLAEARVVSRQAAQGAGLDRAWVTQAALDPGTQSIVGATLEAGSLYVMTSSGTLQAFDAETGATRWSTRLASDSTVVAGPVVRLYTENDETGAERTVTRIAAVAGSRVFVMVETPQGVSTESVLESEGAPAGAPVLGETHAYVASVSGRLVGYPLTDGVNLRLAGSGAGATGDVAIAAGHVLWTSIRGELNVAPIGGGVPYRFAMGSPLAGSPEVVGGIVYLASKEGVVNAVEIDKSRSIWRASLGEEVARPVAVVGGVAYVATKTPTLHAFDAATGERKWSVEGLSSVVAATDERAYAVAPNGAVGVIDLATGRPLASWPGGGALEPVVNRTNDRLYFVSQSGLVQCFHEEGRPEPYRHDGKTPAPAGEEKPAADDAESTDEPAEDTTVEESAEDLNDPATEEPAGDEPADDPFDSFDEGADEPADDGDEEPADEDDPFGDL